MNLTGAIFSFLFASFFGWFFLLEVKRIIKIKKILNSLKVKHGRDYGQEYGFSLWCFAFFVLSVWSFLFFLNSKAV